MMLILSLVIRDVIRDRERLRALSDWDLAKGKDGQQGDTSFVDAMTTALTICIGAMAVVGAVQDGLTGDLDVTKAILDMVVVLVLTVSKEGRNLCGGTHL